MADIQEGQTATNPKTGEQVIFHAGAWHNVPADPKAQAPIVQGILEARIPIPTGKALSSPYWQGILSQVSAKDPSFSAADYPTRYATRKDFTSGKSAANVTSFNTLLHHIATLQEAADALGNHGGLLTPLNAPGNAVNSTFGDPSVTNFEQARRAVAAEAVRAFRGASGARSDVEEAIEGIPTNGSPAQIKGSLRTLAGLLHGRIQSLGEQYGRGMGRASDGVELLDPDARKTLQALGIESAANTQPPTGPGPGGGQRTGPADDEEGPLVAGDVAAESGVAHPVELTAEQKGAIAALARTGGTTAQMMALLASYGLKPANESQVTATTKWLEEVRKNPNAVFQVSVDNSVHPIDAGGGATSALANGVASNIPFAREIGAAIDTVRDGNTTFDENLNRRKGERLFDEQEHPIAYGGGAVLGSLPMMGVEIGGARAAASVAGRAALRGGASLAEARAVANRTFALRTAIDAAAQGGLYSAGNADGSLGERAGAGVAGALLAGTTGGLMTYGGGRIAQAMATRAGRLASQPLTRGQEVLAAADRQGIIPFPADVAGAGVRRATSAVAQTIPGAAAIARGARRTVDSAEAVRDRVAASIATPVDSLTAGETATAGARRYMERTSQLGSRFYQEAERQAAGARVATPEALRILDQEISTLAETPGGANALARLRGLRSALGRPNSVSGLRNMRTALRDEFESAGLRYSNEERIANRVIDAASDDIVAGLRAQGREGAATAYRVADNYWRQRLTTIDQHLEPIIGGRDGKSGEEVVRALTSAMSGNNRRFIGFLNALPADEQRTVRASLIQHLGQASRGQQDEAGGVFSLATFLTHWNRIGERAKDRLFGPEGRAALNDLALYAAESKQAQRFANHSNTGSSVAFNASLAGVHGAAAFGHLGAGLLWAAADYLSQYGAGRLLASPRFARWLARAPRAATPAQQAVQLDRLARIARTEPAITNEVLELQARLRSAFGGPEPSGTAAGRDRPARPAIQPAAHAM